MRVSRILRGKGSEVATVDPDRPISDVVAELRDHGIGAVVVADADGSIAGILSERDIVRALAEHGPDLAELRARDLMTADVTGCSLDDDINEVMRKMTAGRFRHVPVVDGDRLIGIVSIGDAVRARIDELEREREQLQHYITG